MRFETTEQVREFYRERYGLPISEHLVQGTCANYGIAYIPPLEYSTPLSDPGEFERFWECEAI